MSTPTSKVSLLIDVGWMPPVADFDALLDRRVEVWRTTATLMGQKLDRVFAYADIAHEIDAADLVGRSEPTMQGLEAAGLFSYSYGSNLAHGLSVARNSCLRDGVTRLLIVASTMPNTAMGDDGRPAQSFPPGRKNISATQAEISSCTASGLRVDTVAIAGFPDQITSELTAETFLEDLATGAGGSHLTLGRHAPLSLLIEALTSWYALP